MVSSCTVMDALLDQLHCICKFWACYVEEAKRLAQEKNDESLKKLVEIIQRWKKLSKEEQKAKWREESTRLVVTVYCAELYAGC